MNSFFAQSVFSANRASSSSNKPDIHKRIGLISQFGRVNEEKVKTQKGRIEEGKNLARLVTREDEKWNEMSDEDVQKGGEDEEKRNDKDEDEDKDDMIMKKDVGVNKVIPSNQAIEQRLGQGQVQEEEEEQGLGQKQDKNLNIKKSNSSDKMLQRPGTRFQLVSSVLQSAATKVVMAGEYDCDSSLDGAFENMTFNETGKRRGQVQGQGQGQGQGQSQSQAQIGGREGRVVKGGKEGEQGRGERDERGVKDGREGQGGKGDKKSSTGTRHSRPHDGKDDIGNDRGSYRGRERGSGRVEVSDSFSSASLNNIKNVKNRFPTMKKSVTYDSDTSSSSSSSTSYSHSSTSASTSTSISITSTSFAAPHSKKKKRHFKAAIAHTTSFSTSTNSSSTGNDYHLDQVTIKYNVELQ